MLSTAIVGAGPYGLSIAAYFRRSGVPFRIFGRPMDSWLAHMPKGMMLKSDGFASDIYDPEKMFTLRQFCAERGIEYADTGVPVRLDTFSAYGLAFRDRMVPELEDKLVVAWSAWPADSFCDWRMERHSKPAGLCWRSGLLTLNMFLRTWRTCPRSSFLTALAIVRLSRSEAAVL